MKHSQTQLAEAKVGDAEAVRNGELSDAVLDAVIGGRSDPAGIMETEKDAVSADIRPKPINEILGKVRNYDRA